jgi:two-component system sensor histidine kinase RegB
MGLGLFIAKTLLERSGARLTFTNGGGDDAAGAIVIVEWPQDKVVDQPGTLSEGLGENIPIRT